MAVIVWVTEGSLVHHRGPFGRYYPGAKVVALQYSVLRPEFSVLLDWTSYVYFYYFCWGAAT